MSYKSYLKVSVTNIEVVPLSCLVFIIPLLYLRLTSSLTTRYQESLSCHISIEMNKEYF